MKPFKKKSFLAKIFFVELVLICSLVFSFAISAYIKKPGPTTGYNMRSYRCLFDNYRVLHYFLGIPESIFTPAEEKEDQFDHPLSADIMKLRNVESLLKEKKYRRANRLLTESAQPHNFLKKKKK